MSFEDTEHLHNACILNGRRKAFPKQTQGSPPQERSADISTHQEADYSFISPKHQLSSQPTAARYQHMAQRDKIYTRANLQIGRLW